MRKILLVMIILVVLSSIAYSLTIQKIQINQDTNCISGQEARKYLKNQFLPTIETKKIIESLKTGCVDSIAVSKSYPSKIILNVVVKEPLVKIDGTNLTIDKNGFVSESVQDYPKIFLPQGINAKSGEKLSDPNLQQALILIDGIKKSDFTATNFRFVENNTLAAYSKDEAVVLFSLDKKPGEQIDSLQAILAKAKIDASKISKIDLSFDKPIVVFKTNDQR